MAVINYIVWTCNKLSSLKELSDEGDSIAKDIFDNYRHLCRKRIAEADITIFDRLLSLGLQDISVHTLLHNAIEETMSFMSSVASNSTWYMDSGQLKNAFAKLSDLRMYTQIQILDSYTLPNA